MCVDCIELDCQHSLLYCAMCLAKEIKHGNIKVCHKNEQKEDNSIQDNENGQFNDENNDKNITMQEIETHEFWQTKSKIRNLRLYCPIDNNSVFIHSNNKITNAINQIDIICPFSKHFAHTHMTKFCVSLFFFRFLFKFEKKIRIKKKQSIKHITKCYTAQTAKTLQKKNKKKFVLCDCVRLQ